MSFAEQFRSNGRIKGSYVYLVLCEEGRFIFVKIGVADEPIKRLRELATGCPLVPGVLAYVELPSRPQAFKAEKALHEQLAEWRTRGEWFRFRKRDREAFNHGLRHVLDRWKKPSWPMQWTKLDAIELLRQISHAHTVAQARIVQRQLKKEQANIAAHPDHYGLES